MSLTVTKAEGVTVFTVTSNPKSKWPLFFQLLGTLCCSPVCSVSQRLKQYLGRALTALATTQIMIGLLNVGYGIVSQVTTPFMYYYYSFSGAPFWMGGMFIVVGIMCILAEKFPSLCLVLLTVILNAISGVLAITGIVLYSLDMVGPNSFYYRCTPPEREQSYYNSYWDRQTTTTIATVDMLEETRICEKYKRFFQILYMGMHVMMIFFAALQLCVTISWCVLSVKAMCKNKGDGMNVEDPEDNKSLLKEEIYCPAI